MKLKSRLQRAFRGYSDEDIKNFKGWFLDIIPRMLEDISNKPVNIPENLNYLLPVKLKRIKKLDNSRAWKDIIKKVAEDLREGDRAQTTKKNPYKLVNNVIIKNYGNGYYAEVNDITEAQKLENDKYIQKEKDINNYLAQRLDHGFDIFRKIFTWL